MDLISKIENIDCMEFMRKFPDKYFDLAVVDPPYGINASKQTLTKSKIKGRENSIVKRGTLKSKDWDNSPPKKEYFDELFRISKNQIIWGGNYFELPLTNSWIVWNKLQKLETRSDGEMAWSSFHKPLKIVPLLQDGFKRGKNVGYNQPIIFNTPFSGKQTIHPTQKPVPLYDWIFSNYAEPGMKIIDTHLGSGSSRISADKCEMNFWGCELDKEYFEAHQKRWNQYKAQLSLF